MALKRIRFAGGVNVYAQYWPRPAPAPFMQSAAYRLLLRELRRYVSGEVPGRAFLIAGNRGSGKTTLAHRAVEDLTDALFQELQQLNLPPSLAQRPQRPLLVRLHGPTLLASPAKPADKPEAAKSPVQINIGLGDGGATATTEPAKPPQAGQDIATAALARITVALYRALAGAFADAFAIQARAAYTLETRPSGRDDAAELLDTAAQLRLDLDRWPDAPQLRGYIDRLAEFDPVLQADAARDGILWPARLARAFTARGLSDQAGREVIALATAAQAFQVCSGAVTYKHEVKDSASLERSSERSAGIDAKDAVNRIVGLAIGGLLGLGAAHAAGVPEAAGAGAGLLGSLAISASVKRASKLERSEDYAFIRDTSLQTLERDLPLVIERARAAGLAPVFVIDELDKVELPDPGAAPPPAAPPPPVAPPAGGPPGAPLGGAPPDGAPPAPAPPAGDEGRAERTAEAVRTLIRKLKNLTTDFGFFCFLTGPEYLYWVERVIEQQNFPEETTFFSDRLLVQYLPWDFYRFLWSQIRRDPAVVEPVPTTDEIALAMLPRVIVHDALLLTVDVIRALARGFETDDDSFRTPSGTITAQPRDRIRTGVQLAIDLVLRRQALARRLDRDANAYRTTLQALYMVSRIWRRHVSRHDHEITLNPEFLLRYLLHRRGQTGDAAAREALIEDPGWDELWRAFEQLVGFLSDFGSLLVALRADRFTAAPLHARPVADPDAEAARAETVWTQVLIDPSNLSLLAPTGDPTVWRFRFDYDGNPIQPPAPDPPAVAQASPDAPPATVPAAAAPDLPDAAEVRALAAFARAFIDALATANLTFADLAAIGLLPPGLAQDEVERVLGRLAPEGGVP